MTAAPTETDSPLSAPDDKPVASSTLADERIVFIGCLSGMARRDAQQLVRDVFETQVAVKAGAEGRPWLSYG